MHQTDCQNREYQLFINNFLADSRNLYFSHGLIQVLIQIEIDQRNKIGQPEPLVKHFNTANLTKPMPEFVELRFL